MSDVDTMRDEIQLPQHTEEEQIERNLGAAIVAANSMAGQMVEAGKFRSAKVALCRALTAAPEHYEIWSNLSSVLWSLRSYEDAVMCAENSLQFSPPEFAPRVKALCSKANSLVSLGMHHEALHIYDDVIARAPKDDERLEKLILEARWNRSLLLLSLFNYERGFEDFHLRIDRDKKEHQLDKRYTSPQWRGEPLEGKRILLLHDQGYGDTIMFSRFIPWLCDQVGYYGRVYMAVAPNLVPLLINFERLGVKFLHHGAPLPQVDYHTYLGSLASYAILSSPVTDVSLDRGASYIRSRVREDFGEQGVKIQIQEPKASPALKIGICWSGRTDFKRNDERAIPLHLFLSLAESPALWLYSLQMGPKSQEIEDLGAAPFIANLDREMQEKGWIGTATAIMQLDVVVTCCTSIAHLAGTLGVPCWVLLSTDPYWVWGTAEDSTPWYPSIRLFRQRRDRRGDWTCVMEEVRSELFNLLREKAKRLELEGAEAETEAAQ
jgi:tetratricopeptide (TPR) repeat protein